MSRRPDEKREKPKNATEARSRIKEFGTILDIKKAEQPILAMPVQNAIKEWLHELRFSDQLTKGKVPLRSTALLHGPPGTGKTTLAHHIAARLGLPLICIESEGIIDCWVGSSAKNMGEVWDCLDWLGKEAVVLFDEFDTLGTKRGSGGGGADHERIAMLNVMLRRIERWDGIAIVATNRSDQLDDALWRRLGMHIHVALPEYEARYAILKRYADPFVLRDEDLEMLALITENASPSLLKQLMEGMKRALIMGPKWSADVSNPRAVFEHLIHSVQPPPGMAPPALWAEKKNLEQTHAMAWPPPRNDE